MATGPAALGMVRKELFVTLVEAEDALERFVAQRDDGALLQQALEQLRQVRGTLSLIELTGAELLAQEIQQQLTDIPSEVASERDVQLAALPAALHVLRRYLEGVDASRMELPELLIPAIDELRRASGQTGLPESYFFSVRLDAATGGSGEDPDSARLALEAPRLRAMYQHGLLGYLREENPAAALTFMSRALSRLMRLLGDTPSARACWIAAAAAEALVDGQLLIRPSRKRLFARLDRELPVWVAQPQRPAPRSLLKELLYLVALADSEGPLASRVRHTFRLGRLPFTDHLLDEEYQRLRAPGENVMRSLSMAIGEELEAAKQLLETFGGAGADESDLARLHALLGKLCKTLVMVGLTSAARAVQSCVQQVAGWNAGQRPDAQALQALAEALLYVDGMLASLPQEQRVSIRRPPIDPLQAFSSHQLAEAQIVVREEARAGLSLTRRAITAYLESAGDRNHLEGIPEVLHSVRGGLWFLGLTRTAQLVAACGGFIQSHMLDSATMPPAENMEILADALSSLEYHLETDDSSDEQRTRVLDLASAAMRSLGQSLEV